MNRRLVALVVCLTGMSVRAQDMTELDLDHALTFEVMTPHTPWARPYANGKTRVLFFVDGGGTAPRECVELMERFDIEGTAAFWKRIVDSTETHWHGGDLGHQRILKLLGRRWDCFVFLGPYLQKLTAEEQYKLLKPVTEGAGLVFVGATDKRVLKDKNRIDPRPEFLADGTAYRVGQGRAVQVSRPGAIPYDLGWEMEYDYWQEKLGRAVLWAAGKEPRVRVEIAFDRPDSPTSARWSVHGLPAGVKWRAEYRPRHRRLSTLTQTSAVNRKPRTILLASHPAGEHHLDIRILDGEQVVTWATAGYRVNTAAQVESVSLDSEWGEVGDRIRGNAHLSGSLHSGLKGRLSLFDARGRELQRQEQPVTSADQTIDFTIAPWMPMLLRVECALLGRQGELLDADHRWFRVTHRRHGRFNFLIWDTPTGTLAPYAEAELAHTGVTLQLRGGSPPLYVAANDIAWVPYTTRILAQLTPDGIMKPFCWNDASAVEKHVQSLAQKYLPARQHGVFVWSLGDEVHTQGSCLSPHCQRAYRRYLRQEYGSLEALNESWGAKFTDWDQVEVPSEDNEDAAALREKNYPRWFDRQAFQSYNFVQFCKRYAKAYESIDPQALTGFEGAGRFARGDDLDLIVRSLKFWSPYPGTADEVLRSLAPRGFPHANWMGYTKDADSLLAKYWRMVTRGCDAVWWWRWDGIGRFHGWLAPDLRPFPAVQDIVQDTQFLRDGLGDLLLQSDMQDDGIAILYSYPSTFAHKLETGASFGGYEVAHKAVHSLLRELGLQFRYVTGRMLRLGEFDASRYRVLWLPRAAALSDAEAQVIRRFVEGGGWVIADVRPGIYDGHCKPRDRGVLDDLFGVTRIGAPEATRTDLQLRDSTVEMKEALVDGGIRTTTGAALETVGDTPVFITRQVGGGRAVLLNLAAQSLPNLSLPDTPAAVDELFGETTFPTSVRPALRVIGADGRRARGIEVTRWRNGDTDIVSLFRITGERETVTVTLRRSRAVYDLRSHRALGRRMRFRTEIRPSRASFFALAGGDPDVHVSIPATARRGDVVTAKLVSPKNSGKCAVRLRVRCGDEELDWLNRNILVGAEPTDVVLPIAYNDPLGVWRLEWRELYADTSILTALEVRR